MRGTAPSLKPLFDSDDIDRVSSPSAAPVPDSKSIRYVARQPILTREEQVFGYELLFRDGVETLFL